MMRKIACAPSLLVVLAPLLALAAPGDPADQAQTPWPTLRQQYFADRPIAENRDVIALEAPYRAEDAAMVPISIHDQLPREAQHRITKVYLFIDRNPAPLAALFTLNPAMARADLDTRVRIDAYTFVRAVAETDDGRLYMDKRYVKASGGCSAPAGRDPEAALAGLGKVRLRPAPQDQALDAPQRVQLMVKHPNFSGLQMDQLTRLYTPAHFVTDISIRYRGEAVLDAQTGISISENPSLRFTFIPEQPGELTAEVSDNRAQHYSGSLRLAPSSARQTSGS